jgi:hypothetical protein
MGTTDRDRPADAAAAWRRASRMSALLRALGVYAVLAALLVLLVHGMTLRYGFDYDDYHSIRPHSVAEVKQTFSGTWDATGIEVKFFRPLTVVLYALRFHFFGLNSEAYHALSLVMFCLAAVLFGLLARAFFDSMSAGTWAIAAFVVHPAMPYSAVAWITNQMHVLQLLVVLSALLWWFVVRRRSAAWWLPLVLFELAALMVKEDGVMLVPVILVLHWLRRATAERDLPHPPWAFIAVAAAAGAALLYYRGQVLRGLGGYGWPSMEQAWTNYTRGLGLFRLAPGKRPWQLEISWFVTVLPIAAIACWRRCPGNVRFGLLAAIAMGASFNLPFVFVVKAQQVHLVATGAALLIAASIVALLRGCRVRALAAAVVAVSAAGLTAMAAVSRDINRDFEPFGKIILATDDIVTTWAAVAPELRAYLAQKKQPGASTWLSANPAEALDVVTFGLHAPETDEHGRRVRWMAGRTTELYVHARFRRIDIEMRHAIEVFREPVTAAIEVDGRVLDRINFSDGTWRRASLGLRSDDVRWLRRMHHVVIRIDRTWVPADVIAGSQDPRTLGLRIADPSFR